MSTWVNPTSVLGGVLAVLTCGYLAAIFLTAEAHREGEPDLETWSRRRAVLAGVAAGVVAVAGLFVLRNDAPRLYTELLHRGWPLVAASALAGAGALVAALRPGLVRPALVRPLGALAVATVLAGWGSAQYPFLLVDLHAAAAPSATMGFLAIVAVLALLLVVPSLVWLLVLTHRGQLAASDD
jgi:cytochrome d ubiquinol oxidase subunit II